MENNNNTCQSLIIHKDIVDMVSKKLPELQITNSLSVFFKIFGDATRLRILYALSCAEMCVCDLSVLLNMNQSAISHQLATLKQINVVKFRKDGKVVYYSLDDNHVEQVLKQGISHIQEKR